MKKKLSVLLVTDFYYKAKGREYFREDLELSALLRKEFAVAISHIEDSFHLLDQVDLVLLRNTGPQMLHKKHLQALSNRDGLLLFNDLLGKGDLKGKKHLLELYREGYGVVPSFCSKAEALSFDYQGSYLLKPLDGADSCGMQRVSAEELKDEYDNMVVQPLLEFSYEVSFYFIGKDFHYALYTQDPKCRWELSRYQATDEDVRFAKQFIDWNSCRTGLQRVDCCRMPDGRLLLMELEDYNPYLSLDLLDFKTKNDFVEALCNELKSLYNNKQ
ncbi:MAG: hypothetical protein LLF94_06300 [Chlamydiales bacterium]|nr:hypothetical protein [Chlamydiales bacterium]